MYNMWSFITIIEQQFLYTVEAGIKYRLALSNLYQKSIFLNDVVKPNEGNRI